MLIARSIFGSAISGRALLSSDLSSSADRSNRYIVFAGDSNTEPAFVPRWGCPGSGWGRSDVEADIAGEGTLTLYDNSTATWAAFGDTAGAVTAVGEGFVWLESGSAGKGFAFNITQTMVGTLGTELGNPLPIVVSKNTEMGAANFSPCQFGQMISGQALSATANFGANGDTTYGLLERMQQVFTVDSFGRPTTKRPSVVGVLIGINDVIHLAGGGGGYTVNDVKGWFTDIKDIIVSNGAKAIFGNLVIGSPTAPQTAIIDELNAHLASLDDSNTYIADYHSVCDGVADAMDTAHFTDLGAQLAGEVLSPILIEIAGRAGASPFRLGGRVSPEVNRIINGALAGTDGEVAGTMTGVVAIDSGYYGAGACVGSKEAVEGENDWQVYTVTDAESGDFILPLFDTKAIDAGSTIYTGIQISVSGDGVTVASLSFSYKNIDDSITEIVHSCYPAYTKNMGEIEWTVEMVVELPSWYSQSSLYMYIAPEAGDSVIKIRNAGATIYH